MTLENNRAPLLYYINLCASFQIHRWIQIGVTVRKRSIWVKIGNFLSREIWRTTLKNNRSPLLCYFKLCASFHTHWWIQIWVTVRKVLKRSIRVKIDDFLSCVNKKFYRWPSKTIGHLFYATSSFVYHFIPIGEFKLELQPGNAPFWVKIDDFFRRVTFKLNRWPWKTNRAPLQCYFKLWASFRTHWWIQTGVTVQKRPIWVKFDDF